MEKILWCTQHQMTNEQKEELSGSNVEELKIVHPELFKSLSNLQGTEDLESLTKNLLNICYVNKYDYIVLPIGSPAFQFTLALQIYEFHHYKCSDNPFCVGKIPMSLTLLFSHSERVVKEVKKDDGTIEKMSIFKHIKFLKVSVK